jgi:SpoVK/Ycf46/Vps4 family AAA+-type ATPase
MNYKRKKYNNFNTPLKIDSFNKYLITINKSLLSNSQKNVARNSNFKEMDYKYDTEKYMIEPKMEPKIEPKIESKIITEIHINVEINEISDLLHLISTYKIDENVTYNINMKILHDIKEPLNELNNMIGMKELKKNILDQIIYFIQELNKSNNTNSDSLGNDCGDFMHTVIYGPPGTGKTEIAKILGKIFSKMNILSKGTFKKVTRSDLVAGYLGQTAIKTKDVIKECLGGILFIDEAYSLGNSEKRDSYSKECIDTLCEALSDHKDNLMVIIAGYENELENCFFNYNQGLNSRFTWRFKTDDYTPEDLYHIFIKKVHDNGWSIHNNSKLISNLNSEWFAKNKDYFKFYGRDIETFLAKTKIAHSRRVFCKNLNEKKKITYEDIEQGLIIYLNNNEVKNRKETENLKKHLQFSMYS